MSIRERERERERFLSRNARTPRNTAIILEVSYMNKSHMGIGSRGQSFATSVLPPVT